MQEGHYSLYGPGGKKILPWMWEACVEPGMSVIMIIRPTSLTHRPPHPRHQKSPLGQTLAHALAQEARGRHLDSGLSRPPLPPAPNDRRSRPALPPSPAADEVSAAAGSAAWVFSECVPGPKLAANVRSPTRPVGGSYPADAPRRRSRKTDALTVMGMYMYAGRMNE